MASATPSITVPVKNVAKDITVTINVAGMREYRVRLFLASILFRLGAWVMWAGLELQDE